MPPDKALREPFGKPSLLHRMLWIVFMYLALFSAGACLIAVATPLLAAGGQLDLAGRLYELAAMTCDQIPSHTIWVAGYPMALCARCVGIYTGLLGVILTSASVRTWPKWLFMVSLLAGSAEKLAEMAGLLPDSVWLSVGNPLRFGAGVCWGMALTIGLYWLFNKTLRKSS